MGESALNINNSDRRAPGGFSNTPAVGKLPAPLPSPLMLNLGCGNDIRSGYVNIDLFSSDPSVVRMDIRRLELEDSSADSILASDILEHFSHRETTAILQEWARVLKPGGELIIRCPSLKLQVNAYLRGDWDADVASYMIFGGQTNPGDFHCNGFDDKSIVRHLNSAGFDVISVEDEDYPQNRGYINLNMTVRAVKKKIDFSGISFTDESSIHKAAISEIFEPQPQKQNSSEFSGFNFQSNQSEPSQKAEELQVINDKMKLNIVWEGSQFVYHSLALINREHCFNLIRSRVANLTLVPYEYDKFLPEGNPKYELLKSYDVRYKEAVPNEIASLPYIWIRHQWPPKTEPPAGAKWIIMQPWEYTRLRKDFVELFNQAEEIWTPSTFCRKCFVESGVEPNKVQVIPNGINPELYKPSTVKLDLLTKKKFKFLFVGGTIYRKGIDLLLQTYIKTFTIADDVCLVIKDMGGDSFYRGQTAKEAIANIRKTSDAPEIVYIDGSLSEEEMAALYNSCDVFVSPYRGEGFSLPTLEAMACGLPVIVTKGGSSDDFVDEEVGWQIPAEMKSVGDMVGGQPLTEEAFLLEPDMEELENILRFVYDDPREVFSKGLVAQLRARKFFTWNRATLKLLSRIDLMYGLSMAKSADTILKDKHDAFVTLGEAEWGYNEGRYDRAMSLYKNAYEAGSLSDKHNSHCLLRLAELALMSGEPEAADEYASKAALISIDNCDEKYISTLLLESRGELVEALECITPAMDDWRNNKYNSTIGIGLDDLLCKTGDLLRELGDLEGANKLYTTCLEINNANACACLGSAKCFIEAGLQKEARTMLDWAIRLRPDYAEAVELTEQLGIE